MSDYQRFISYLYEYQNNKKTYNRGFLKAESRSGILKLEIHIKDPALSAAVPVEIFGFIRRAEKLEGIRLGEAETSAGHIACCLKTQTENLNDSGIPLSALNGILLLCRSTLCYASTWDDLPFFPERVSISNPSQTEEISQTADTSFSEEPSLEAESLIETTVEEKLQPSNEATQVQEPAEPPMRPEPEQSDLTPEEVPARWERVLETYEAFQPFSDGSVSECVKLELKDLPALRKDRWLIGSNPLILHAYSTYHHLILGRLLNDDGQYAYFFGIPGAYSPREKFMAEMYGFPNFKPAAHSPTQRQGYWYRILD